jgi:cholesterol oxidase
MSKLISRRLAIHAMGGSAFFARAAPLTSPWSRRKPAYEFVVVGSGYGGSVVAARLAAANLKPKPTICVLECGTDWSAGSFPDRYVDLSTSFQSDRNPTGLFGLFKYGPVGVLKGCGVGGGSLIDAGVASVPEAAIWDHRAWPKELRADHENGRLAASYERARTVLALQAYPRASRAAKAQALSKSFVQPKEARFAAAELAINWGIDGVNRYGAAIKPCIGCGDCLTGCNAGAKNSLDKNYLCVAANGGAEIYGGIRVQWIEQRKGKGYRIHLRSYGAGTTSMAETLDATNVILAAGSPGSAEILLRSEMHGLPVSRQIGERFGGNGEVTCAAYATDYRTDVIGWGTRQSSATAERLGIVMPGPSVAGRVQAGLDLPSNRHIVVEDLSCPSAMVLPMKTLLGILGGTGPSREKKLPLILIDLDPTDVSGSKVDEGALNHSLLYRANGIEEPTGKLAVQATAFVPDGRLLLRVPPARNDVTRAVQDYIRQHVQTLSPLSVIDNIFESYYEAFPLLTQPLGGCPMGETADTGVVNHRGEVFASTGGALDGLYVMDASTIPAPLGTGPLLTVTALAERSVGLLVSKLGGGTP